MLFLRSSLKQAEHDLKRLLVMRELTRSLLAIISMCNAPCQGTEPAQTELSYKSSHFAPATARRTLSTLLALQERFRSGNGFFWHGKPGFLSGPERFPPVLPTSPKREFSLLAPPFSWANGRSGCGAIAARAAEREPRSTTSCRSHDVPCANFYEMNGAYSCTTALADRNSRLISVPGFQKAGITLHEITPSQLTPQLPLVRGASFALEL